MSKFQSITTQRTFPWLMEKGVLRKTSDERYDTLKQYRPHDEA